MAENYVALVSSDGRQFIVPKKAAYMSTTLKNMLDTEQEVDENSLPMDEVFVSPPRPGLREGLHKMVVVPLPNVHTDVLASVIEYCQYHAIDSEKDSDHRRAMFDDLFLGARDGVLMELLVAANYLDIKPLLDLVAKTIADMIRGKSVEEIRTIFGITNDLTPEEEEQIRKENEWCEAH